MRPGRTQHGQRGVLQKPTDQHPLGVGVGGGNPSPSCSWLCKGKAEADFTRRPLRTDGQVPRKLLPSPFTSNSPSRPPQQTHRGPSLGLGGGAESPELLPPTAKGAGAALCRAGESMVGRDNEWKRVYGQYTQQPALQGSRKEKGQGDLGGRARRGSRREREAARGRGREAVVRRYHGRLQGRGLLGWAYETVFVVALWLRQENRWFSSSRVTKAAQVRLPDLPCPRPGPEELGLRWPP